MTIQEISECDRVFWADESPKQRAASALINFGQIVCQPFFLAFEKLAVAVLLEKDDRILSIFQRCVAASLYAALGTLFLTGWVVGSCMKMVGCALSGRNFIYRKGEGREQWGDRFSLLSFNAAMYESGFPVIICDLPPACDRIERLIHMIVDKDPEIVVFQEFSLGPSEIFMDALKEQYPHFYTNVGGPNAWIQHRTVGPELFIASKAPIVSEPKWIPFERGAHKLGFFCLETPTCWVVNAHFPEEEQEEVLRQVATELSVLNKPCVLAADLNYRNQIPKELFYDAKAVAEDDYVVVDQNSFQEGKIGVESFEVISEEGLSDHKPLLFKIWTRPEGASP